MGSVGLKNIQPENLVVMCRVLEPLLDMLFEGLLEVLAELAAGWPAKATPQREPLGLKIKPPR